MTNRFRLTRLSGPALALAAMAAIVHPAPADGPDSAPARQAPADAPPTNSVAVPVPGISDKLPKTDADPAHHVEGALLGDKFQSPSDGIGFRAPADCKKIEKAGGESIVDFINDERVWRLRVTRSTLQTPQPLVSKPASDGSVAQVGVLDYTAQKLIESNPGSELLRKDVINEKNYSVGLVVLRYTQGGDRWLRQQAMLQVNDSVYYVFNFTTPATKQTGANVADPGEKLAVDTFNAVLDSIEVIDRSHIALDQRERLFRTRSLFVTWNQERILATVKNNDQQFLRLIRDGKDIGWTYVVQAIVHAGDKSEFGGYVTADGLGVYVQSHTAPDKNSSVDAASRMYCAFDRSHEDWMHTTQIHDKTGAIVDHNEEWGASDHKMHLMFSEEIGVHDKNDPKAPATRPVEAYALQVESWGKKQGHQSVHQDLAPWYIPQAIGQVLPQLLPLEEPKGYLFATYVSERKQVWHRYIDVSKLQEITFAGKKQYAVVITDKIGLEGSPTLHYYTLEGRYIGSENKDFKIVLLPTDKATLLSMWPGADLKIPDQLKRPEGEQSPEPTAATP